MFVSPTPPIARVPPCTILRITTSSTSEISGIAFSYSSKDDDERHTNEVYSILPSPLSSIVDPVLPTRTLSDPLTSTTADNPSMRSPPSTTTEPPNTDTPSPNVALPAPPTCRVAVASKADRSPPLTAAALTTWALASAVDTVLVSDTCSSARKLPAVTCSPLMSKLSLVSRAKVLP